MLVWIPAGFVAVSVALVVAMKWIPVVVTAFMVSHGAYVQKWVPIEKVAPEMIAAVIEAEDAKFFSHNGFDWSEIRAEVRKAGGIAAVRENGFDGLRGCSTISQQTAKNCFTRGRRTWFRKAVEAYFTVLIERIWGKKRILEIYLNIAQTGPGMYGVEAAAQKYFSVSAWELKVSDAASLACCLPNPGYRTPEWVERYMGSRRSAIARHTARLVYEPTTEELIRYGIFF